MKIFENLSVEKIYSISSVKKDRFLNMIQMKKDFNIEIEMINPIFNKNPRTSHSKTLIDIIKKAKGKYKKILIFEDDAWTDLSETEIEKIIINSGVCEMNYDILSLGSQCYSGKEINEYLYFPESFGYAHSLIFNIEKISEKFLNAIELLSESVNLDCAISRSINLLDMVLVIKDSIYIQALPSNIDKNDKSDEFSLMFNIDFRSTRDYEISSDFICHKIIKNSKEDSRGSYLEKFGTFKTFFLCFHFKSMLGNPEKRYRCMVSSYNSGAFLYKTGELPHNFFFQTTLFPGKIVIEIFEESCVVYRKIFDPETIQEGESIY